MANCLPNFFRYINCHQEGGIFVVFLGPVYTELDKFGTGPRLGPDRPYVHTGPPGTGTMWVHLPGTMWVQLRKGSSTDLDWSKSRVNGQDRPHYGPFRFPCSATEMYM